MMRINFPALFGSMFSAGTCKPRFAVPTKFQKSQTNKKFLPFCPCQGHEFRSPRDAVCRTNPPTRVHASGTAISGVLPGTVATSHDVASKRRTAFKFRHGCLCYFTSILTAAQSSFVIDSIFNTVPTRAQDEPARIVSIPTDHQQVARLLYWRTSPTTSHPPQREKFRF